MPINFNAFAAKLDPSLFATFLTRNGMAEPPQNSPDTGKRAASAQIQAFLEGLDPALSDRVFETLEFVHKLSTAEGEAAVTDVGRTLPEDAAFHTFEAPWDRALWLLVNDRTALDRAETRSFARRHVGSTKYWNGFVAERRPKLTARVALSPVLQDRWRALFSTAGLPRGAIEFDAFEVHPPNGDPLIQVSVFIEEYPTSETEYRMSSGSKQRSLAQRTRRPALEFALTYIPSTGLLEVVGKNILRRSKIEAAQAFSEIILLHDKPLEPLKGRLVSLGGLAKKRSLPIEPNSPLKAVRVTSLTFASPGADSGTYTVSVGPAGEPIWDMISLDLELGAACLMNARVVKATISFQIASPTARRGFHTVPVTLSEPSQQDLANQLHRHRKVIEDHLVSWGLLKRLRTQRASRARTY